jgi:hypothetical protein
MIPSARSFDRKRVVRSLLLLTMGASCQSSVGVRLSPRGLARYRLGRFSVPHQSVKSSANSCQSLVPSLLLLFLPAPAGCLFARLVRPSEAQSVVGCSLLLVARLLVVELRRQSEMSALLAAWLSRIWSEKNEKESD